MADVNSHSARDPQGAGDSLLSAEDNRRMFDRIARRYDLLNRLLSLGQDRRWRRKAVAMLDPQAGQRLLDIGCGTADVCIEILARQGHCRVVGIDPSRGMLDLGAEKVRRAGLQDRIRLQAGDGAAMDFADGSFDGAISAFCLRNMTRRAAALAEMLRVLRPGGKAAILELTVPPRRAVRAAHRLYGRWAVPAIGRLLSRGRAYQYLVDSIEDFSPAGEVLEMMAAARFVETRQMPLSAGIVTVFVGRRA